MLNLLTPDFAIDVFSPIAKWLAIGIVSIAFLVGLVVFFAKKDAFSKTLKILSLSLFVFLLALGISLLVMSILKEYDLNEIGDETLRLNMVKFILIPLLVVLSALLLSVLVAIIVNKFNKEKLPLALRICGAVCLLSLIASGITLALYFNTLGDDSVDSLILYILAGILVVIIVALAFILDKNKTKLDTKCIAMAGITIAMSFGLSYIRLFKLPQGGSVTLFSLLPIMIFSFIYGTKKGVLVCFCYGILQAVQDPWIIHPAQFLLDYPVAFSAIGLCGMFANINAFKKIPQVAILCGGIISSILRFASHVFSGVFAFSTYAGDVNPWIYSIGYNSFVFADMAITLVVAVVLFSSKTFLKEMNKNTLK